jgi:CRP-like cAMP-binding protein
LGLPFAGLQQKLVMISPLFTFETTKTKQMSHLSKLASIINTNPTLSEEDCKAFLDIWEPFEARRKETLTHTGEKERFLYFVNEGVQRIYYFDEQEREATIVFTYGPSFGGVLDSFMLQKPSKYFYETLTASSFIRTPHKALFTLMSNNPAIDSMIRAGITEAMSGMLERMVELQCFSSEEKFRKFMQRSPHMLQLVPHKYLANYLGIDATNFSKLINKVKI